MSTSRPMTMTLFLKLHVPRLLAPILLALSLAGCAVSFIGAYDPLTDEAVQELSKKTEIHVAGGGGAAFYKEERGSLAAIETRIRLNPKNTDEIELIGKLREAYQLLETAEGENGSLRSSDAGGVRSLLRQLIYLQTAKRPGSGVQKPTKTSS